jgi:hypothetical protein
MEVIAMVVILERLETGGPQRQEMIYTRSQECHRPGIPLPPPPPSHTPWVVSSSLKAML